MLAIHCDLIGVSPLGFSAPIQSPKLPGEQGDAYEERIWRERMHVDQNGEAFITPAAIKNCLADIARYRSDSVPGKGKTTYTKFIEAGILVTDPCMLGVKANTVQPFRVFVPSSGKRGDGKRVWKNFPHLPTWKTHAAIYVLDPVLSCKQGIEKLQEYLDQAGKFIGLGPYRPRNNGYWGRFEVANFKTVEA